MSSAEQRRARRLQKRRDKKITTSLVQLVDSRGTPSLQDLELVPKLERVFNKFIRGQRTKNGRGLSSGGNTQLLREERERLLSEINEKLPEWCDTTDWADSYKHMYTILRLCKDPQKQITWQVNGYETGHRLAHAVLYVVSKVARETEPDELLTGGNAKELLGRATYDLLASLDIALPAWLTLANRAVAHVRGRAKLELYQAWATDRNPEKPYRLQDMVDFVGPPTPVQWDFVADVLPLVQAFVHMRRRGTPQHTRAELLQEVTKNSKEQRHLVDRAAPGMQSFVTLQQRVRNWHHLVVDPAAFAATNHCTAASLEAIYAVLWVASKVISNNGETVLLLTATNKVSTLGEYAVELMSCSVGGATPAPGVTLEMLNDAITLLRDRPRLEIEQLKIGEDEVSAVMLVDRVGVPSSIQWEWIAAAEPVIAAFCAGHRVGLTPTERNALLKAPDIKEVLETQAVMPWWSRASARGRSASASWALFRNYWGTIVHMCRHPSALRKHSKFIVGMLQNRGYALLWLSTKLGLPHGPDVVLCDDNVVSMLGPHSAALMVDVLPLTVVNNVLSLARGKFKIAMKRLLHDPSGEITLEVLVEAVGAPTSLQWKWFNQARTIIAAYLKGLPQDAVGRGEVVEDEAVQSALRTLFPRVRTGTSHEHHGAPDANGEHSDGLDQQLLDWGCLARSLGPVLRLCRGATHGVRHNHHNHRTLRCIFRVTYAVLWLVYHVRRAQGAHVESELRALAAALVRTNRSDRHTAGTLLAKLVHSVETQRGGNAAAVLAGVLAGLPPAHEDDIVRDTEEQRLPQQPPQQPSLQLQSDPWLRQVAMRLIALDATVPVLQAMELADARVEKPLLATYMDWIRSSTHLALSECDNALPFYVFKDELTLHNFQATFPEIDIVYDSDAATANYQRPVSGVFDVYVRVLLGLREVNPMSPPEKVVISVTAGRGSKNSSFSLTGDSAVKLRSMLRRVRLRLERIDPSGWTGVRSHPVLSRLDRRSRLTTWPDSIQPLAERVHRGSPDEVVRVRGVEAPAAVHDVARPRRDGQAAQQSRYVYGFEMQLNVLPHTRVVQSFNTWPVGWWWGAGDSLYESADNPYGWLREPETSSTTDGRDDDPRMIDD